MSRATKQELEDEVERLMDEVQESDLMGVVLIDELIRALQKARAALESDEPEDDDEEEIDDE